ncbi:MAG: protein-glutamate O-methyltransferase CheR [Halothiobacillus sp.]|jgi:chemotaxis protein methyltransferase CheR|uniref:CheR family methyltransferase n=1 Tax=Halothiobacillus sp. TaxID=1891311 RepID=UPI002AD3539C|nr:protein-glutamate O-methyltransferase CheR [Halothiobacillus sp.]MDA3876925.1 protein-glutamate O-methyltransferase CheR [Halothiobacillus sp.]
MQAEQYQQFCELLERQSGILLGADKRYLVETRLGRVLREQQLSSMEELVDRILKRHDSALLKSVIEAMTTNETLWFRDDYPFQAVRDVFFPEIPAHKRSIRIWSAACSSGQEPYSLSMIVSEVNPPFSVEIVGTDLSSRVLEQAKSGIYDELSLGRGLSDARRRQFFEPVERGWQLKPELRRRVRFQVANLLDSVSGLGRFDIIFCRNVLIYFSRETKSKIINRLADALVPNGRLVLGASESVQQLSDRFDVERLPGGGMAFRLKR